MARMEQYPVKSACESITPYVCCNALYKYNTVMLLWNYSLHHLLSS